MSCQRENFSGTLVDASKNLIGGRKKKKKKKKGASRESKHGRELLSAEHRVRVCARACVRSRKAGRRREWRSVVVKEKKKSQTKRECSVLGSEEDRIHAGRADSCLIDQKVILKELETLIPPSDRPSFHTVFQQKCSELIARHQDHQTSGQF